MITEAQIEDLKQLGYEVENPHKAYGKSDDCFGFRWVKKDDEGNIVSLQNDNESLTEQHAWARALKDQNWGRVEVAGAALKLYVELKDGQHVIEASDVTDLLTDLRHYCAENEIDFDQCLELSKVHFDAEKLNEF
jgi:hypothetical protein